MADLTFRCYQCNQNSPFEVNVENRDEVQRFMSDGAPLGKIHFICTHCGFANAIEITIEVAGELYSRLSHNDEVRDAAKRAAQGDFSKAADVARKFGFKI